MDNLLNSDTSQILKAIENFFVTGDKDSFAEGLRPFNCNTDSDIYVQTVNLLQKISDVGVNYFVILVQHPSISSNESRCLLTWCSDEVFRRFSKMWKNFESQSPEERQKLNQAFLNTYSKSIGRLDSFSEACLRYVDRLDNSPNKNTKIGFFNINIEDKPFSLSKDAKNKKHEITLVIENKYYEQLCSVINEDVPNNLLKVFFKVFVKEYKKSKFQDSLVFDALKDKNFELVRNGLIGGVSSKIHLEEAGKLQSYYEVANDFLRLEREKGELGYNDLERFLGVIQTYAMWSYLTGKQAYFYFKVDEISNVGIYTYSDMEETISDETRKEINRLIFHYFDLLYEQVFGSNGSVSKNIKPILLNSFGKTSSHAKTIPADELLKGISEDEKHSFSVFSDIVSHLREVAKHEGKQLFFNIAIGNDEYLRAYFKPLQPRLNGHNGNDIDNRNKWSINFNDILDGNMLEEKKLKNEISRVCSLILGNYSFLQEEDVWLCFSFNRKNVVELRYLAKIKDRISYSINEVNGFDYINKFTAVSRNLPEVFVAKIYKNKKALIGYKGFIRLKHIGESWVLGHFPKDKNPEKPNPENPILDAYVKIESRKIQDSEIEKERTKIFFRTMDSISKEDGLGAMFVVLKGRNLRDEVNNYIADMTEVIEMVKGWKFSELKDEEYLYKLAIQDGATIIDYSKNKIEGRKLISNTAVTTNGEHKVFDPRVFMLDGKTVMEGWQQEGEYKWSEYGKWYEWGARRMTGAALAHQFRGQLEVFIISSDGEVFFLNGKNIFRLDRNKGEFVP